MSKLSPSVWTVVAVTLLSCLLAPSARSESTDIWARRLGGPLSENLYAACKTSDGGIALAASTYSYGTSGDSNYWVVKLNSAGQIEWQKAISRPEDEEPYAIIQTTDGGFFIVGYTYLYSAGTGNDIWGIKLTSTGAISWERRYYGSRSDNAGAVIQTPDGGFLVGGTSLSFNTADDGDALLIKLDTNGNRVWHKPFYSTPAYHDAVSDMITIPSGEYLVVGETFESEAYGRDPYNFAWVMKVSSTGAILWKKIVSDTTTRTSFSRIVPTGDGNYLIGGWRNVGSSVDGLVAKVDASGNLLFSKRLGSMDSVVSLEVLADGDILIGGYLPGSGPEILRCTAALTPLWQMQYSSLGGLRMVSSHASGGFIGAAAANGEVFSFRSDSNGRIDETCGFVSEVPPIIADETLIWQDSTFAVRSGSLSTAANSNDTIVDTTATNQYLCPLCTISCNPVVTPNSGVVPLAVVFTASPTTNAFCEGGVTYDWDFGDGSAHGTVENPSHSYMTAGTYLWTLSATADGVTSTTSGTVVASDPPCTVTCSASATPASGMAPLDVAFSASASPAHCTGPVSYLWNFGDGEISAEQNPTHRYASQGFYSWTMAATVDGQPCTQSGTVSVEPPPCTITCEAASNPLSGPAPLAVQFTATAVPSNCAGSVEFQWSFGDGGTSTLQNPIHTYAAEGTYTWSVTASVDGATAASSGVVTVSPAPVCTLSCSAGASPSAGTAPLAVAFSASATAENCSGAPAFSWAFGDGAVSSAQNPSHTYATAGTYEWVLTVSADGTTCVRSGQVLVSPPPCTLACSASATPPSGSAPLTVQFSSSVTPSHCAGTPAITWNFGDGQTSSQQNPSHTYSAAGSYAWTLLAMVDGVECNQSGTVNVAAACVLSCTASATPASGHVPLTVQFVATASPSNCAEPVQYLWNFGDGATSSAASPTHVYTTVGTYSWSLTAWTGLATCTRTGQVSVTPPCTLTCTATARPTTGPMPLAVRFIATASPTGCDGTVQYGWTFGDGATSTEQNPRHTYENQGTYSWTMTATVDGTTCGKNGTVTVTPPCTITCQATASKDSGPAPLKVYFTADAQTQYCSSANYWWDFGDGESTSLQNPYHIYTQPGVFEWTMTATASGKTCAVSGTVTVGEAQCSLTCQATLTPFSGNAPLTVQFSGSAQASNCGGAPNYSWDFGDGFTSTQQNPSHTYTAPGTYTWSMVAEADGVTCGKSGTAYVFDPGGCTLTCEATASPSSGVAPLSVSFSAHSSPTGCSGSVSYSWSFGDGSSSGQQSASHTYSVPGTYLWTLTATVDGTSCARSGTILVQDSPACTLSCEASVPLSAPPGSAVAFAASSVVTPADCASPAFNWNFGDGTANSPQQNATHIYESMGTYTWTLTVSADGTQPCVRQGQVVIETAQQSISMGELTFYADSIVQENNAYLLTGGVSIDRRLYLSGPARLQFEDATHGELMTDGVLSVAGIRFLSGTDLRFYIEGNNRRIYPLEGPQEFDIRLAGLAMFPQYGRMVGFQMTPTGIEVTPVIYIATQQFSLLEVSSTVSIDEVTGITAKDFRVIVGDLAPGVRLVEFSVEYFPEADTIEGSATLDFPFLELLFGVTVFIKGDCWDGVEETFGNPWAFGIPPLFSISAAHYRVDHLCDPPPANTFGADLAMGGIDPYYLLGLEGCGYRYRAPFEFGLEGGTLTFLGHEQPVSVTNASYLSLDPPVLHLEGEVTLGDVFEGVLNYNYCPSPPTMSGHERGVVRIPDWTCDFLDPYCIAIKKLVLMALGQLPYELQEVECKIDGRYVGDVQSWVVDQWVSQTIAGITIVVNIQFSDGALHLKVGPNMDDLFTVFESARIGDIPCASERGVERVLVLSEGRPEVTFAAVGIGGLPSLYLVNPAGSTITPVNVADYPDIRYGEDPASNIALFFLPLAAQGTWTIGTSNLGADQVTLLALSPRKNMTARITEVSGEGLFRNISLAVQGAAPDANVSIWLSRSAAGRDMSPLLVNAPLTSNPMTTTLSLGSLKGGTYYIFCQVSDGKNPPITCMWEGGIAVPESPLIAPTGLSGVRSGAEASLRWQAVEGAAGYLVVGAKGTEEAGYPLRIAETLRPEARLAGLDPVAPYRFAVQAFDADGKLTLESAAITLASSAAPGDCDGDGTVSIGEVQKAINMFLGSQAPDCGVDCNGDGIVSIGEVQKVINIFLGIATGC